LALFATVSLSLPYHITSVLAKITLLFTVLVYKLQLHYIWLHIVPMAEKQHLSKFLLGDYNVRNWCLMSGGTWSGFPQGTRRTRRERGEWGMVGV